MTGRSLISGKHQGVPAPYPGDSCRLGNPGPALRRLAFHVSSSGLSRAYRTLPGSASTVFVKKSCQPAILPPMQGFRPLL